MPYYRSHYCAQLNEKLNGQTVKIAGWIHRHRDHGGVTFVDLRDRSGLCQVVIHPNVLKGRKLRAEFVLQIEGKVIKRPEGMINKKIESGAIEVHADSISVLAESDVLPFPIDDENIHAGENIRLKYRYLDLRRPDIQKNLILRHKVLQSTRRFFTDQGFLEIETPILYKSTPEGARDYLVPSRVHPGSFYALPQSPQTLKQLLMISGFDRYFQIVRCFRDEDLRSDRQPEFTQVDLECSFLSQEEFMAILELYIQHLWKEILDVNIPIPFQRMSYKQAIDNYGSDKPDLRYDLSLMDVTKHFENSDFKVFSQTVKSAGKIVALPIRASQLPTQSVDLLKTWSRKVLDGFSQVVEPFGLKGVAWIQVGEDQNWRSAIAKFFKEDEIRSFNQMLGLENGDYVLFGAEKYPRVNQAMGALRQHVARELKLVKPGLSEKWPFVWITEFPLFEYDPQNKRLAACHHPFTRCVESDREKLLSGDQEKLLQVRAQAYDLALNGYEIAGGSLRIYDSKEQHAMFKALGFSETEAQQKFGFFLESLKYGTPPHGGIAFGLDRLVMCLAGTEAIRDVIAFPKTANAQCLMSETPSQVSPEQLAELRLQIIKMNHS